METGKQKPGGGQAAEIQVLERATNEGMGTGPTEPKAQRVCGKEAMGSKLSLKRWKRRVTGQEARGRWAWQKSASHFKMTEGQKAEIPRLAVGCECRAQENAEGG